MRTYRKLAGSLLLAAFVVGCQDQPDLTSPNELTNSSGAIPSNFDLKSRPDLGGPVLSIASGASALTITAISNPNAAYVGSTALIDISGLGFLSQNGSISDATQTVTFSATMQKRGPVPSGWATWSSPPFSETGNPHVLFSNFQNSRTLTLSLPTSTFGFELEPNLFATFSFTATFFSGGSPVGSITRSVAGAAGARLFAAQSLSGPIDRVDITVVGNPSGFSIARVRYIPVIQVDIDIKPGSDPNSINCNNDKETITVAILTTDDFDATTVDHTTVTFEGASETHVDKKSGLPRRHEEDVDGDEDTDLVLHFRLGETGLDCGSTDGTLEGETFGGQAIEGTDAVRMIGDDD